MWSSDWLLRARKKCILATINHRSFCNVTGVMSCTLLMQNVLIPSASLYRTFTGFTSATLSSWSIWSKKKAWWLAVAAVVISVVTVVTATVPPFLVKCFGWCGCSRCCGHCVFYGRFGHCECVVIDGVVVAAVMQVLWSLQVLPSLFSVAVVVVMVIVNAGLLWLLW